MSSCSLSLLSLTKYIYMSWPPVSWPPPPGHWGPKAILWACLRRRVLPHLSIYLSIYLSHLPKWANIIIIITWPDYFKSIVLGEW